VTSCTVRCGVRLAGGVRRNVYLRDEEADRTWVVPVFTVGHTAVGGQTADRMAGRSDIQRH